MPTISKIRFANVIYEQGLKRYHDETFLFDTQNGAILLENGGGKTVFIQAAMQAIIPHASVSDRQIKETLYLEEGPAHIAIEWLLNERPRQYVVTAVTLYLKNNRVESLRYIYAYSERDKDQLEYIPFTKKEAGIKYPASKDDIQLYYQGMVQKSPMRAKLFPQSIKAFTDYLEENYLIIREEWENMILMNSAEGGIEKVFEDCKGTQELFDRLLIPSVENADKHYNPLSMTDQFEKQRSNLKKYKQFNEKKLEYQAMEQQMDHYVERFQIFHEANNRYEDERHYAAAYFAYLKEQQQLLIEEITSFTKQLEILKQQQFEISKRHKALTIYEKQEQENQVKEHLTIAQGKLLYISEQIEAIQHEQYSLKYAIARERIQQAQETIEHAQELLRKESEKENIEKLNQELVEFKGQWLFLLEEKKTRFETQLQGIEVSISETEHKEVQAKEQLQSLRKQLQSIQKRATEHQTRIDEKSKNAQSIKNELVANENEQIQQLLKEWTVRAERLEKMIRDNEDRLKALQQQLENQKASKTNLEQKKYELLLANSNITLRMDTYKTEEIAIKEQLRNVLNQVSSTVSIYERASSYTNQLQEKIEYLQIQRAEKLIAERKATRYLDDYGKQQQFFADPYLAEQIQHWSQFSLIQTGVEYLQSLEEKVEMNDITYPFWAITLITTAQEKQDLIDKIHVSADKIMTPIIILSREEARAYVQGEPFNEAWIAPTFWRHHVDQLKFSDWKNSATEHARQMQTEREEVEQKLNNTQMIATEFQRFLEKYPYPKFNELREQQSDIEQQLKQIEYTLKGVEEGLEETDKTLQKVTHLTDADKGELNYLQLIRIPKAEEYTKLIRQIEKHQKDYAEDAVEIETYEKQVEQVEQQVNEYQHQWLDAKDNFNTLNTELKQSVLNHEIYREREKLQTKPAQHSEHKLSMEVNRITMALNQMSETIQQLKERIKHNESNKKENESLMERTLIEFPELNKMLVLSINPDDRLNELHRQFTNLKKENDDVSLEVQEIERKQQKINGQIQILCEQYGEKLPPRMLSIEKLKQLLLEDEDAHSRQKAFTDSEFKRLEKLRKEIEVVLNNSQDSFFEHQLNKIKEPKHQLSSEQQTSFLYDYSKEINQVIKTLAQTKKELELQQKMINQVKENFRKFCSTLQDQKLSKVTMDGIENRKTFKEISEHRELISQTIQQAIHIADVAIQEYDKDQQQIIQYAVQQLARVRHSLLEIPKKTRIRTADETKYIYQFTIPDWEEHEAKEAIRSHIDWILTMLEQDKFQDEYGNEDITAVRKFLEKHLQTVPLLRQVLGNKKMAVKCRKVESERQVSNTFYSWEESNKWSGGEKWSKNMALYLGILKFIAEKAGSKSNMKRERTLMLDNPFGKASSDHVLSPVFYIAEQLGFQIIALTAHAEGKFIADYFPIVYSCRLRSVRNASHQVVQKEQQLNKAFFADREPDVLHYVGEKKQLSLFAD